ncbi:SAV_915 family protein [Microbacterium testaceum]|uniref:SAV_915 family protein n=1 Tax=Microbacterium testaceum TaxID=2033 RepID=UPI001CD9AA29|nr:SAV_915 family protein [Microbacterium testaceum]
MALGGSRGDTMRREVIVPPALYLPLVGDPDGRGQQAVVQTLVDGRRGLLAYTALDRLADACGREQPWMLLMTSELDRVRQAQPFDVVAFDLDVPPHARRDGRLG